MSFSLNFTMLANDIESRVSLELFSGGRFQLTQGLHKLASQLNYLLLTEKGTVAGLPNFGLEIRSRLGLISLSETAELDQIVSEILTDATNQLQTLTDGLPDDERLGQLSLVSVAIFEPDEIQVNVSITSVAGSSATYDLTLFSGSLT